MSESTRDALYDNLVNVRTILAELWEAIDDPRDDVTGERVEYEGRDPHEYLDEMPLEIVWEMGEPFAVILGTGGPHIEITGGGRQGGYQLHGYWGGEHVVVTGGAITRTGEYFRSYIED